MSNEFFDEDLSILREFVAECNDMIADVEVKIIELSGIVKNNETPDLESINSIFRLFHTIKGTSSFLNLTVMQEVTHEAETLLDCIRKGEKKLTNRHLEVFIGAIDFLKNMLPAIEKSGSDAEFSEQAEEQIMQIQSVDYEDDDATLSSKKVKEVEILSVFANIKDEGIKKIAELTAEINLLIENPTNIELLKKCYKLTAELNSNFSGNDFKDHFNLSFQMLSYFTHLIENDFKVHTEDLTVVVKLGEVISEALLLEQNSISNAFGMADFMSDIIKHDLSSYEVKEGKTQTAEKIQQDNSAIQVTDRTEKREAVGEKFIRVDLEKIDKLIDWIGELSIAEMMLINNPDIKNAGIPLSSFENSAHNVNRILSEIQFISMSLRMVPIKGSFSKMSRLVHDLTGKFKKEIKFITEGEDTEIDKNVAEQIIDPLMHMVRNSFDHGIEDPKEREAKGKPIAGTITLSARHVGGEIWISISDDGKGLDKDRILAKALKNGLTDQERVKHLSDDEIYAFIFQPGFSTAEKVSELSGRGVGMDVVKRNIDSIKGQITIQSKPGLGSVFILKIPLTMAIIEALLIRVGANRYTIPLAGVTECSRADESEITISPSGEEFVKIRKSLIQVVRLHRLFGSCPDSEKLHEGILMTIKNGSEVFCLFVDEIMEQLQAIVKPLPEDLGIIKGLSGCTILGDGSISPIVDITGILALNREKSEG